MCRYTCSDWHTTLYMRSVEVFNPLYKLHVHVSKVNLIGWWMSHDLPRLFHRALLLQTHGQSENISITHGVHRYNVLGRWPHPQGYTPHWGKMDQVDEPTSRSKYMYMYMHVCTLQCCACTMCTLTFLILIPESEGTVGWHHQDSLPSWDGTSHQEGG